MNPEFEVHLLNPGGVVKAQMIATILNDALNEMLPLIGVSGRETAIVRTKLEEASFFAKKAMAKQVENQKSQES
jgi:hypothetical protein